MHLPPRQHHPAWVVYMGMSSDPTRVVPRVAESHLAPWARYSSGRLNHIPVHRSLMTRMIQGKKPVAD